MRRIIPVLFLALASGADAEETRSITVTAVSEVKVVPDEVVLTFSVDTEAAALLDAKKKNDEITSKVFALAPQFAIEPNGMTVTQVELRAGQYSYNDEGDYTFARALEVRLTDFKQIEPFLAALITAGVDQIDAMEFRVRDQRKHQTKARELAIGYAREKARHLTELTNMTLGQPIRIEENQVRNFGVGGFASRLDRAGPWRGFGGGGFGLSIPGNNQQNIITRKSPVVLTSLQQNEREATDALIAPGHIRIEASVTVEFEMSKK
ncbi:MAG: SIMPL domain-containing protein [Planctomycetaceae bacterium]